MNYLPAPSRYQEMAYRSSGNSGLQLPLLSLGLWHNFGAIDAPATAREILLRAFDAGILHFDLANNYGPPPGSAEETLGRVLKSDLSPWRDELIISTKAGFRMWDGPYGVGGSRKYLLASLDQSLRRLGLDYVDIFYSHCADPGTPVEETMGALTHAVRSGKAIYAGISNYDPMQTALAIRLLREAGTPCVIHQVAYNLFQRKPEEGLWRVLREEHVGSIVFCPLAQGLLTDRYAGGALPADSRAVRESGFLYEKDVHTHQTQVAALHEIAQSRGQTLAQMALAWTLRDPVVSSALLGVSRVSQLEENLGALKKLDFTPAELAHIDSALRSG